MARFGSFAPYPRRFGGGPTRVRATFDSLNEQLHGANGAPPEWSSVRYARNLVVARMLAAAWASARRVGGIRDPWRTVALDRLERIHRTVPRPGDTEAGRRRRLAALMAREGERITRARIEEMLREALGELFVAVEFIDVDLAVVHVPANTYPWGTVVDGVPWYSTVAHTLVLVEKPAFMTEAEFYDRVAGVHAALDPVVPVWATFDWYRAPLNTSPGPVDVVGGPSMAGFYLDDDHNLDNNVFD